MTHPDRTHGAGPEPFDACPDGGRCWHDCPGAVNDGDKGLPCWRVLNAQSFTEAFPGEDSWPEGMRQEHRVAERRGSGRWRT